MYDELVKALRGCVLSKPCDGCPYYDPNGPTEKCATMNIAAADAIEELQKALNAVNDAHNEGYDVGYWAGRRDYERKWIPVTERLPETSGVYLAWMQWDMTDPDDNPSAYPIEYDAEEEAFGWWRPKFNPESLGWAGEDFIRYEGVTHWMPLPEPPKEE